MDRVKEKVNKQIKKVRKRSYLARDFDSFKAELYDYARTYFGDSIADFSEASVGGLFLDLAAMVGDTMSFYLDHQFNELNWETAVENKNIVNHLRMAGVKQSGVSAAVVDVTFSFIVPAQVSNGEYSPDVELLPTIGEGTEVRASGIKFTTTENLYVWETDRSGSLIAKVTTHETDESGNPTHFLVEKNMICISGKVTEQSFRIPDVHKPFRTVVIGQQSVTDIISVMDSDGNEYYEVESLTQDTIFKGVLNLDEDQNLVHKNLEIVPATHRFIKNTSPITKLTTLQFGSGDADSIDDDIIPDPSDLSLPLYGKKTFSRFSIDPSSMLTTQTLGISPKNTVITVKYRYGGGLSHNIGPAVVRGIDQLYITWPLLSNPTPEQTVEMNLLRNSIRVTNDLAAVGGAPAPEIEELRAQIPAVRSMQSRVVTKDDLLARVYTMPSDFGRVYRAGIHQNPNNPLAAELYIACRDNAGLLTLASDSLKKNLRKYINEFRLISDAIDILDATIINLKVDFTIVVDPNFQKQAVIQEVIRKLKPILRTEMFQIDQPIIMTDLMNSIINTQGVISITSLDITCRRGIVEDRLYSDVSFNVTQSTAKGLIVGPPGSIFEIRYPENDIVGNAT